MHHHHAFRTGWQGAATPYRTAATLLICLGLLGACGCATTHGPEDSDLPWSTQEGWESTPALPGGMMAPGAGSGY